MKFFPGCRVRKVIEEVKRLSPKNGNSCIIAHVGSNDLFLRSTRAANSEPIVKDLKTLVNEVSEKTTKGIVVSINERIKKYCEAKKVEFLDLWSSFMGKWHFFKKRWHTPK